MRQCKHILCSSPAQHVVGAAGKPGGPTSPLTPPTPDCTGVAGAAGTPGVLPTATPAGCQNLAGTWLQCVPTDQPAPPTTGCTEVAGAAGAGGKLGGLHEVLQSNVGGETRR